MSVCQPMIERLVTVCHDSFGQPLADVGKSARFSSKNWSKKIFKGSLNMEGSSWLHPDIQAQIILLQICCLMSSSLQLLIIRMFRISLVWFFPGFAFCKASQFDSKPYNNILVESIMSCFLQTWHKRKSANLQALSPETFRLRELMSLKGRLRRLVERASTWLLGPIHASILRLFLCCRLSSPCDRSMVNARSHLSHVASDFAHAMLLSSVFQCEMFMVKACVV